MEDGAVAAAGADAGKGGGGGSATRVVGTPTCDVRSQEHVCYGTLALRLSWLATDS